MNEPENNLQNAPRSVDSNETHEALRRQINLLFGALIIVSFTLTAYLAVVARRASLEYLAVKTQADEVTKTFQQESMNVQADFLKLQEFARTHPDFQNFQKQLFAKYKISETPMSQPAPVKK